MRVLRVPGARGPVKSPAKGPAAKKKKGRSFWKELPVLIVVALLLTLVIKTYAIQAFYIPSGSMQNTLAVGDRVLVNKVVYDVRSIHRGDIVVFSGDGSWNPGTPPASSNFIAKFGESVASMFGFARDQNDYIKRVIGVPGDHVACCDAEGRVTVNGVPLNEKSYLFPGNSPSENRFSVTVPANSLWVMGDHRDVSWDSRGHRYGFPGGGSIPESAVVGRAFIVIWPFSQWARTADSVHVRADGADRIGGRPPTRERSAQGRPPWPRGRSRAPVIARSAARARLRRGGSGDPAAAQAAHHGPPPQPPVAAGGSAAGSRSSGRLTVPAGGIPVGRSYRRDLA